MFLLRWAILCTLAASPVFTQYIPLVTVVPSSNNEKMSVDMSSAYGRQKSLGFKKTIAIKQNSPTFDLKTFLR